MRVEQLMTKEVFTCKPQDSLERAAGIFWEHDCGCAPVVDDDRKVVGIVTDRDACIAAYMQGKSLREIPVSTAMSRGVFSVRPDDDVSVAEKTMTSTQVRRLPVVSREGRLVGLVSLNDLANAAARERAKKSKELSDLEVAETLSAVCKHRAATATVGVS